MSSHTHTNLNVRNNTQNTSSNYAHKQMYTYSLLSGMVSSAATALREDLNLQLLLLLVFLFDSIGLHLGLHGWCCAQRLNQAVNACTQGEERERQDKT